MRDGSPTRTSASAIVHVDPRDLNARTGDLFALLRRAAPQGEVTCTHDHIITFAGEVSRSRRRVS